MDIVNSCTGAAQYGTIVYYSHLIPVAIALLLGIFTLVKSKFSILAKVFFLFIITFCIWLLGDIVTWVSTDYSLITVVWAPLDYINIIFYILAAYFFAVMIYGKDMKTWQKVGFFALSVPAWIVTVTGNSIPGFNQPWCEAFNNEYLTQYKLAIEVFVCLFISISGILALRGADKKKKGQIAIVGSALILFFITFSITEYISSQTGIYEINLYGLFVLPVFLFMIIYSIVNLEIFKFRLIGTQLLAYTLIIMVGSQFFFLENSTSKALTLITFALSLGFGVLLIRSAKREIEAREKIEKLAADLQVANVHLEELNRQKSEFVSFASHQLRSPLTSIKGNSSLILEGDAGPISPLVKQIVETILEATKTQINVVESYLNSSRIELGTMKYSLIDMDFKMLTEQVMNEQKPNIEAKGLTHTLTIDASETYKIKADPDKFKQVLMNIVDNSLKYTAKGSVNVSLIKDKTKGVITFKVSDTGVGIRPDVMPKLFQKFSRADNANEANIHGTGLGLYIARDIVKAHNGRVWAESEGEGKGSQFYVEVPEAK